jgi:hypothetical protein
MRLNIPKNSRTPRRRIGMSKPAPPMLIRLTEDVGKLPAGFVYELPAFEAKRLLTRRKATAVGMLRQTADLALTPEEYERATA